MTVCRYRLGNGDMMAEAHMLGTLNICSLEAWKLTMFDVYARVGL